MIELEQIDVKLYDQGTIASETDRQTDGQSGDLT